ncbi:phosphatidic acid phosphatase type [Seminavis robusta]|uniref:Phosphatidic acid phosphatase type n=1 Tax=Seminavis robusta TaxID=568900 RepID=A0A9N8H6T6_9STRA|nr:phosphatidic acid phosphatase type [Seminavis robusta]|eukprot:Sro157_g071240.1 phosphatidic acid phosphatase type (375) ;mRNA; f:65374-66784
MSTAFTLASGQVVETPHSPSNMTDNSDTEAVLVEKTPAKRETDVAASMALTHTSMATDPMAEAPSRSGSSLSLAQADAKGNGPYQSLIPSDDPNLVSCHTPPTRMEVAACSVFFVVVQIASLVAYIYIEPTMRPIPVDYLEGSQEYIKNQVNTEEDHGETLGTIELIALCWLAPFLIQAAVGMAIGRVGDTHRTLCVWATATSLTSFASALIKSYVGYLRPVFFEWCEPDEAYGSCSSEYEREARTSFISGHASFAFVGCVVFSMFLEYTFGLSSVEMAVARHLPAPEQPADGTQQQPTSGGIYWAVAYKKSPGLRRVGSFLALLPVAVAIWVACSRVVDNVHFPADIVGGALVGAGIASFCHKLWFPEPRFMP